MMQLVSLATISIIPTVVAVNLNPYVYLILFMCDIRIYNCHA